MDLAEEVIRREWDQFQRTENEGGRASCQGNWPMFHQMRASQFMTWPEDLLRSYLDDLDEANRVDRNLVTEKYARMMASTAPDEYRERIEPFIPRLSDERVARQERVIAVQVAWARDFRGRYPKLGAAMRVLTTAEDTPEDTSFETYLRGDTSFETYLRGELGTYSDRTMALYEAMVENLQAAGRNLTEQTVANTVRLGGFADLEEAESAQAA